MKKKLTAVEEILAELGDPAADRDYQPGHERVVRLLSGVTRHRPKLRIRVAGTNGKGSTATMLAAVLQSAGLKVGLYTSPHLLQFNERIRINGAPVDHDALIEGLGDLLPRARAVGASYFETATALALDQFARSAVDVEILEAGVGARLDATTAVEADMALITPIALDHQAWLGDTLGKIATEKAYVMKGCRFSISALQSAEVMQVLRDFNADICFADLVEGEWDSLKMPGNHQQINATLAYAAIKCLCDTGALSLDLKPARQAIADCVIAGRLQHVRISDANIWLDAAHNRHAIEALLPALPGLADPFDGILIFTREDRSLAETLPLLKPFARTLISGVNQAETSNEVWQTLGQAIEHSPGGNFLVLGSFTTVAAILRKL